MIDLEINYMIMIMTMTWNEHQNNLKSKNLSKLCTKTHKRILFTKVKIERKVN